MYEYYKENLGKLRKEMDSYLKMVRPEVEALFHKPYSQAFDEVWQYYEREMLEHLPYIGGDSVSGTGNLTGSTFLIAIALVGRDYGLSTMDWGRLSKRYVERIPSWIRKLAGRLVERHPGLAARALKRKDAKNVENARANPESFVTRTG